MNRSIRFFAAAGAFAAAMGLPFPHEGDLLRGQAAPQSSQFKVDPFWPKPLPNDWVTGNVGGTCVDKNDHVFIVSRTADPTNLTPAEKEVGRAAPPVIEFDPEGNVVNSWGDPKIVPNGIHDCYFDPEGNIWIGGNTDAIAQKYSRDGKLLLQIGTKGKFDTADSNQKAAALNASHTLLNRPASFAVDPANGEVYIADGYGNRRVVVFDREGKYVRQFGRQATKEEAEANAGGVFLGIVHCVVMSSDGLLYVCDRDGKRIQVFDKAGNFKKNIFIKRRRADLPGNGSPWWIHLSHDPAQKTMYVADGVNEVIWTLDRESGQTQAGFGTLGHMAGEFTFLHTITMNSKGDLFIGETVGGRRVQKFKAVGN
ncbi:MAG TPA: two-component regulator propeller domain-containing protein [Candidatus Binatia bacterium]